MFDKYCNSKYREDIQGLRAIGAIMIMIFHIWLHKVSGGVDVFFVISGFLMSSILLKSYCKEGITSPTRFWGGIIKRVAPCAYIILGATLIASCFLSSPTYLKSIIKEVAASALFLENIELMKKSVDYLALDQPASPVQQFWALSIQIQFYIVLPLIIIPLAKLAKKRESSKPLFIGVASIIVSSFIYALIFVADSPTTTYFNPLARVWEFFFGVLAFLTVSHFKTIKFKNILAFAGLLLIIGGAFIIPKGAAFPGLPSLVPVLGAVFVITSGIGGFGWVNKLLANKVLVFIGGISFSIYLWHWPILIFYKEYFHVATVSVIHGLVIMFSAITLAYLTSKTIERPFNKIPKQKVRLNFTIGGVFLLPVLILAVVIRWEISSLTTELNKEFQAKGVTPFSGATITLNSKVMDINYKEFIAARSITPTPYNNGCHQKIRKSQVITCTFGDLTATKKVILVGGSHATQWFPALNTIAENNNFQLINMTKSGCPLGVVEGSNESCRAWNKAVITEIIKIKPDAIITNSTRTDEKGEHVPASYISTWQILAANNIKVIGIRDNPRFDFNIPDCIYRNRFSTHANPCSVNRSDVLLENDPAIAYKDIINSVDMSDMLCTKEKCLTQFSGYLMYRDDEHLHLPYVKFMKNKLKQKLAYAMPEFL